MVLMRCLSARPLTIIIQKAIYRWCLMPSATLRVAGSLQKSTEVMQAIQLLIKVPEVAATMRELSKEMMRVRSL